MKTPELPEVGYFTISDLSSEFTTVIDKLFREIVSYFVAPKIISPESGPQELEAELLEVLEQATPEWINERRLEIIEKLSTTDANALIFQHLFPAVRNLIGPDILIQKGVNLVVQTPFDSNPSELHRDIPGNSPFELVCWVPLVDCVKSMCMYLLDAKHSLAATRALEKGNANWENHREFVDKHKQKNNIERGSVLIFWSGLWHGSDINQESRCRLSLNFRVKNVFTPNGYKNPTSYFRLYSASTLARLGMETLK